jgi:polar amino acid transport system substrate-binding protein
MTQTLSTGTQMQRPQRLWPLFALLFGLLVLWTTGSEGADAQKSVLDIVKERGVLRAGIRTDNPPHGFITQDGHWVGFDVDIAEAVAKELGVKLEKVKVDELTRISYLQTGQIDIAGARQKRTLTASGSVLISRLRAGGTTVKD